jgi:single-strand DNA-binding protein
MSSVNKVILVGRLGNDPELRHTSSGQSVTNFRLATNERWTGADGSKQERTQWHRVVAWGKIGEICTQYTGKGSQVYIEGSMQTNEWTDREGIKRFTTEIRARNVVFLGSRSDTQREEQQQLSDEDMIPQQTQEAKLLLSEDDSPF